MGFGCVLSMVVSMVKLSHTMTYDVKIILLVICTCLAFGRLATRAWFVTFTVRNACHACVPTNREERDDSGAKNRCFRQLDLAPFDRFIWPHPLVNPLSAPGRSEALRSPKGDAF